MNKVLSGILVSLSLFTRSYADSNQSTQNQFIYIDTLHKSISETVMVWSENLDKTISGWLEDKKKDPEQLVDRVSEMPAKTLEDQVNYVDTFFQTRKYIDETDNTYIRLRTQGYFQTKESADYGLRLSAQLPFKRSRKNLRIFIEDVTTDNASNILKDDTETPSLGISYFRPERYGINSKYSLGLQGIDPYVRARYNRFFKPNDWLIDLSQAFQYSTDDKFEEETNIYFDRQFEDLRLFRVQLHRSTHQEIDGMDYVMSLQYYCCRKKNTGLRLSQTFIGNTEYPYIVDNGIDAPYTKTFGGINNYVTTLTWRRNVWKNWFFYEVRPAVSFHKQYDYDPNYTLRVFFDFYFGKFY